jgi:hypothetical protein
VKGKGKKNVLRSFVKNAENFIRKMLKYRTVELLQNILTFLVKFVTENLTISVTTKNRQQSILPSTLHHHFQNDIPYKYFPNRFSQIMCGSAAERQETIYVITRFSFSLYTKIFLNENVKTRRRKLFKKHRRSGEY